MKKKILVTGGTGTIGKALIPQLLQNDYEVVTLSRRPSDNIVPHWQIDLTQPHELEKVVGYVDQVIHLAANVDACNGPSCFIDNVFK